ncbi:MAG: hypothetical protein ACOYL5_03000 [Phototrophicaceae bacterium]
MKRVSRSPFPTRRALSFLFGAVLLLLIVGNRLAAVLFPPNKANVHVISGANVLLDQPLTGSQAAFADTLNLTDQARIDGNALLGATHLLMSGTINGDLAATGDTLLLDGQVTGDVVLMGTTVTVTGAIDGDMLILADTIQLDSTRISGQVMACGTNIFNTVAVAPCDNAVVRQSLVAVGKQVVKETAFGALVIPGALGLFEILLPLPVLLQFTGLAALLVIAFPQRAQRVEAAVRSYPRRMVLIGSMVVLLWVGISGVGLILLATVPVAGLIVLPLYLLGVVVLLVLFISGWVGLLLAFGEWLNRRWRSAMLPSMVSATLGGVIVTVVGYGLRWLPLGGTLTLAFFIGVGLVGVGASYMTRFGQRPVIARN